MPSLNTGQHSSACPQYPAVDDVVVYMGRRTLQTANHSMCVTLWQDVFPEILYWRKRAILGDLNRDVRIVYMLSSL